MPLMNYILYPTLATLTIPIIAPLARFSGVGGALVVTAFQAMGMLGHSITAASTILTR